MLIRFTKLTQAGNIQIQSGELLDLPEAIAEQHIMDCNAVAVTKAELATMPRHEMAQPIPVTNKPGKRGRR